MRVPEFLGAGMSPGRPVGLGKCCVYTHLNWCLLPACFSGLPLGLMNKALREGAMKWEDVAPFLGFLASTICGRGSRPWSASAGHWIILYEVLRRVLDAESPAGVCSYHHHQGHHHLLQAGIETVRAARSTNPDPTTISFIYPSEKHLPNTCYGNRAVPGAVWGNQANTTKSDWVAAVSCLFLSDPLTLPYPPVGCGASLALLGAQWEKRTQSTGYQFLLCSDLPGDLI